jgi:hypothetical protein
MRTNEIISAEEIRRKPIVASLGKCQDGEPVIEGQEFRRSSDGIRHALCLYDPAYARRVRELRSKTEQ